jgi:hypothetical protein
MDRICIREWSAVHIPGMKRWGNSTTVYSRVSLGGNLAMKGENSYYVANFPRGKSYYISICSEERWLGGKATIQHRTRHNAYKPLFTQFVMHSCF